MGIEKNIQGVGNYEQYTPNKPSGKLATLQVMSVTVLTVVPRLPEIVALLANPPAKPAVHTTAGILNPPLGATRYALG